MSIVLHTITAIDTSLQICGYLLNRGIFSSSASSRTSTSTSSPSPSDAASTRITETDITNKLEYTQSILYKVYETEMHIKNIEPCHPIVIATSGVIESLQNIKDILVKIESTKRAYDNSWAYKWFFYPNYNGLVNSLSTHVRIHDMRLERLLKVLPFANKQLFGIQPKHREEGDNTNKNTEKGIISNESLGTVITPELSNDMSHPATPDVNQNASPSGQGITNNQLSS